MFLVCSRRCGGALFRALFAEVDVDSSGEYQDYRVAQPGYVCLNCGAPALDLSTVRGELEDTEREEEAAATAAAEVLCPICETMVKLDVGTECPNCGTPLVV